MPDSESLEAALSTLLPRLLPSFRLTTATTLDEETEDELAALQSIFGEELAVETLGALRLCSLQAASAQGPVLVVLCLAPHFGYPQQAPIALIDGRSAESDAEARLHALRVRAVHGQGQWRAVRGAERRGRVAACRR